MKNKIQHFLDEYVLGNTDLSEIPNFAIKLIEEGYESESLYILSGLPKEDWQDIKLYFEKTIKELNLNIRSIKNIFGYRFEKVINKEIDSLFYDDFHEKLNKIEILEEFIKVVNKYGKKMNSHLYDLTIPINGLEAKYINGIKPKIELSFSEKNLNQVINKKIFISCLEELNIYSQCLWLSDEDTEYIKKFFDKIKK